VERSRAKCNVTDLHILAIKVLDYAGGGPVEIASGVTGLVYSLYLGKRRGWGTDRLQYAPHSVAHVFLGTVLLWYVLCLLLCESSIITIFPLQVRMAGLQRWFYLCGQSQGRNGNYRHQSCSLLWWFNMDASRLAPLLSLVRSWLLYRSYQWSSRYHSCCWIRRHTSCCPYRCCGSCSLQLAH
jgi:hypothetical protein